MQEQIKEQLIFPENNLIAGFDVEDYRAMDGSIRQELVITLHLAMPAAKHFFAHKEDFFMTANRGKSVAKLHALIFSGELRYYYEDYKNYYYLPMEDMAIHKSVAAYVDKAHRKQATATTAYLRRSGTFLPQLSQLYKPAFKKEYWGNVSYFEIPKDLRDRHGQVIPNLSPTSDGTTQARINNDISEWINDYARHILAAMGLNIE